MISSEFIKAWFVCPDISNGIVFIRSKENPYSKHNTACYCSELDEVRLSIMLEF